MANRKRRSEPYIDGGRTIRFCGNWMLPRRALRRVMNRLDPTLGAGEEQGRHERLLLNMLRRCVLAAAVVHDAAGPHGSYRLGVGAKPLVLRTSRSGPVASRVRIKLRLGVTVKLDAGDDRGQARLYVARSSATATPGPLTARSTPSGVGAVANDEIVVPNGSSLTICPVSGFQARTVL